MLAFGEGRYVLSSSMCYSRSKVLSQKNPANLELTRAILKIKVHAAGTANVNRNTQKKGGISITVSSLNFLP